MTNNNKYKSQFDPNAVITEDSIALTLIRSKNKEFGIFPPKHAMIIIESVKNNEYIVNLTDLVNPYTRFQSVNAIVKSHWGHSSNDTHVRFLTIKKPVEYHRKSQTWVVGRDKADLMLKEIQDEVDGKTQPPAFYLLGGKSVMTYLTNYQRHGKPTRNCIHWALDKLRLAGINLSQNSLNIMTDSSDYTDDNKYHLNPYGINELFDFIRLGRTEAIRRFFPPNDPKVDLNQLAWGDVGPVEFQLRNYTPLMIACGYGHWDIAKMLINEYGVDVNVRTEKGLSLNFFKKWVLLSYNALDCAEKNIFGITKIFKQDDINKQEVINLIKEKMHESETLENTEFVLA